jgi:hypothetical protein
MNKKGLILIFLFVMSMTAVAAVSNASNSNDKVEITLRYYPNHYVDMGYVWVEFDERILTDNNVLGVGDILNFAFFYDVAVITWAAASQVFESGWATDAWWACPENNVTEGYQGSDLYNCTRFAGMLNVMLDDYDLGMSNFDISSSGNANTYQDFTLQLDIGWHFLTVMGAELVSDANHTTWEWQYSKDDIQFYVGETRKEVPSLIEEARWNFVQVNTEAVGSEDLGQAYNWTDFYDFPHPVAEPVSGVNQDSIEVGVEGADPIISEVEAQYNASDMPLGLVSGSYGVMFADVFQMGPSNYSWFINNGDLNFGNNINLPLSKGINYVWFIVFGFKSDDYSLLYGNPSPSLAADTVVFRLYVGVPVEPTGPSYVIFISVSILGLVTALYLMRRRK